MNPDLISTLGFPIFAYLVVVFRLEKAIDRLGDKIECLQYDTKKKLRI